MSAGPDIEIARMLGDAWAAGLFAVDENDEVCASIRGSLLWLSYAILKGYWVDFGYHAPNEWLSHDAELRKLLDALPFRPLLEPWLTPREWSDTEVAQLKTAHAVTQSLTNKDHQ